MTDHSPESFAYDRVPYVGCEDPCTHVRQLEALATILGLSPAPVTACRVLEIGSASGRNLIPQAVQYPSSRFQGLDLSRRQIESGRAFVRRLELTNIDLTHASLEEVDEAWGQFDYILCPGVFSWVAPPVQEKLLSICKRNLAPQGVALVSYNTYPGWRFHDVARDIMRYHAGKFEDAGQQVLEARKLIQFMAQSCPDGMSHRAFFEETSRFLDRSRDAYVFHDFLAEDNYPLYFHEFVARAEKVALRFLAEANFANMVTSFMPDAIRQVLERTPTIQREQLLDFIHNTAYRKTLLCHQEIESRSLNMDALAGMYFSLRQVPDPRQFDVTNDEPVSFALKHRRMTTSSPLGNAALRTLIDIRPASISLDQLRELSFQRLSGGAFDTTSSTVQQWNHQLAAAMAACFGAGLVNVFLHPPTVAQNVSRRPTATRLARAQAEEGEAVTSELNEPVRLEPQQRRLLLMLNGKREVRDLPELLSAQSPAGPESAGEKWDEIRVRETLETFREAGLLSS